MADFRIAAAQVATIRGDLARNVVTHAKAIAAAAAQCVSVLVFPELSLTGYEPDFALRHAIAADDARLAPLSELARQHRMHIAAGAPLANGGTKPALGAVLFGPDGSRRTYAKMHLGGSEPNHYTPGRDPLAFETGGQKVGLSICADSSQPSHSQKYAESGATVYAAGVFLNAEWYASDVPRLAAYALRHRMLVVMANHGASVGSYVSVGRSAIWAPDGDLLAQAEGVDDSLIVATRGPDSWRAEVCPI
jgi:predicted amidohydrolase